MRVIPSIQRNDGGDPPMFWAVISVPSQGTAAGRVVIELSKVVDSIVGGKKASRYLYVMSTEDDESHKFESTEEWRACVIASMAASATRINGGIEAGEFFRDGDGVKRHKANCGLYVDVKRRVGDGGSPESKLSEVRFLVDIGFMNPKRSMRNDTVNGLAEKVGEACAVGGATSAIMALMPGGMVQCGRFFQPMLRSVGDCTWWLALERAVWANLTPEERCQRVPGVYWGQYLSAPLYARLPGFGERLREHTKDFDTVSPIEYPGGGALILLSRRPWDGLTVPESHDDSGVFVHEEFRRAGLI